VVSPLAGACPVGAAAGPGGGWVLTAKTISAKR